MLDSLQITDKVYERYSKEIDSHTYEKFVEVSQAIHSKKGVPAHITKEVNERALSIGTLEGDSPAYMPNMKRLDDLARQQTELRIEIEELEAKLANRNKVKLNKEEFLNLRVDNEKVVDFIWNEPFASLVKAREIQIGGGGRS